MNKFLLITKINLLSFFNLQRVTNSKYKKERKRNVFKVLFFIAIILYLSYYVYEMTLHLMPGFISINMPIQVLGVMFTVTSLFIFFYNLFKVKNILFDFKDYELLNSLPIKRSTIILSKLTSTYLLNLLYTFVIMIPSFIAYTKFLHVSFGLLYFILLFIIPVIPLLLSYIVGIIISWLSSFFPNKNIGSYIINLSIIIIVMLLSFRLDNMDSLALATKGMDIFDKVGKFYPLSYIFINLLNNFNIVDLFVFILIPVILTYIFILIINNFYGIIRDGLLKSVVKGDYKVRMYKRSSQVISLYHKELKKYLSNSMYVLNTIFGCILIIVMILGIILFSDNTIEKYLHISNFGTFLKQNIIFMLSLCSALSCTTHPSISLEGKSLWIMKMLPVSSDKILFSKMLVNLTFVVPTILIAGTFFGIYLHFSLLEFLLIYITPLMYTIFISTLGLIFNLLFPNFNYDNEIKVIKQSMPAFLTIFVGMLVTVIPFTIGNIDIIYIAFITSILFIINISLIVFLHYYGNYRIKRL
jgi:ABC-2 type transport system permease protein